MSFSYYYKVLHPSTAVEHCLTANFTAPHHLNLILAKTNFLEIYRLVDNSNKDELQFITSVELFGNIRSIAATKFAGNKRDSILILFEEEAKISVVDYDQSNFDLKTVSLHYLEDEYLKEGRCTFTSPSRLIMDPYNRCSATLFFDSKLVVIPFREESTLSMIDDSLEQRSEVPVKRHKIIDLKEMNLLNIKDYCFLHGYSFQPTVLILHENEPTWSGRFAMKHKTCSITAISLDLNGEKHPIIWQVPNLPHECYRLIPLKDTIGGGVVIASYNGFIHVNQKVSYILSLNDMCQPIQEHNVIFDTTPNALLLDFAAYTFLANDRILFSLKKGELYCLYLNGGGRTINQMQFLKLTTSVIASSMCTVANRDLFIGSRVGDSLFISYKEKVESKRESMEDGTQEKKRQKLEDGSKKVIDLDAADDFLSLLEEDETEDSKGTITSQTQYELKLLDSFLSIGPSHSVDIGNAKASTDMKKGAQQLVACSGYGKNGSIHVLTQHLKSEMILEQDLPFYCNNMWTIKQRDDKGNIFDNYLIISTENATKVLYAGEGLDEVTNSSTMITSEQTIMIGNCMSVGRSIQICKNNILLLEGNKMILEYQLSDRTIYKAHVEDPFVLLHFTSGDVLILEVSQNKFERVKRSNLSHHGFGKVTACNLFKLTAPLESFEMVSSDTSKNFISYYCIVCWSSGAFEMYSLPDFKLVFVFTQFISMHSIVYDMNMSKSDMKDFKSATKDGVKNLYAKQVILRSVGEFREDPHLFILLNDNSFLIYRSFFYNSNSTTDRLSKLRFKKLKIDYTQHRIRDSSSTMPKLDFSNTSNIFPATTTSTNQNELIVFDQVGKYSGLFQTGSSPIWIFSDRGKLRIHPMAVDGNVGAFTSLHANRFKFGFAYFGVKNQKFRLCQLDGSTNYNATWPTKRIPLGVTPQKITYHEQTDTYLVSVSKTVVAEIPEDIEMLPEGRFPIPIEERSEIRVYNQNWKQIDQFNLEVHEQVLSSGILMLAHVDLEADEQDDMDNDDEYGKKEKVMRPFIVIGTGYTEGEDQAGKGRILIFDFEAKISEENKRIYKLSKAAREKTVKGPVSAVAAVEGYLLATAGPKIMVFMFDYDTKKIQECGFYDAQFYIPSMLTIKDYVLYGDVLKSLNFLRWKEKGHKMLLLSKDTNPLRVTCAGLLIYNNLIGFISADAKKNIKVFAYKPNSTLGGHRGKKLVPVADFHTGLIIHNILRIQSQPNLASNIFCALDGSIGIVTPIDERVGRVFTLLQNKMYTQIPHACGLHPKRYRLFESQEFSVQPAKKNIMDGQLLHQFNHLDYENQRIFANMVGTRLEVILDAMELLQSRGMVF